MKFKILFIFVCFLFSCTQKEESSTSLIQYIPENTSIVIKINDLTSLKNNLTNTPLITKLKKTDLYTSVSKKIKTLEFVKPTSTSLLLVSNLNNNSYELAFITTRDSSNIITLEKGLDIQTESITSKNLSYNSYKINNATFYSSSIDNAIIISSSLALLEDCINTSKTRATNTILEKLYTINNTEKAASIFINTQECDSLFSTELKDNITIKPSSFSDWISLDLNTGQDYIHFNGATIANDSIKKYTSLFKNTSPLKNTTPFYAPKNTEAIVSYTFNDYYAFLNNQQKYISNFSLTDSIFNTVEEVGIIFIEKKKSVLLNTYGAETILEYLNKNKKGSFNYQGNEITELSNTSFLNSYFNPLIQNFSSNYYTILENAFIFSTTKQNLQTIISNYKNGTTFNNTAIYKTSKKHLATESNFLFVANHSAFKSVVNDIFSESISKDFKTMNLSNYVFATQLINDINFCHTNTIIQKIETGVKNNTITPLYTIQLENEIVSNPQFVVNHQTKKKEIIVQDNTNNLYLQVDGRLQGKVKQVDLYKNGKLQLAFTTDTQFLIIDRNGKNITSFNKTYDGGNLNELAVFNYENKKDYRFVVTQGTKIFMYNNKGAIVDGFTYTSSKSPIIDAPQHFRINKKDYLVFKYENKKIKILNRIGNSRIKVNQKIDFSNNSIKLFKNKFTLTNKKGVLHQIDEKGKLLKTNLNLNQYHGFDATNKTFVYINDNILSIKGRKVFLELGVYSKPQIFYRYNKIYVSVTDLQNQKIYLFDSNAKAIPNFPVFGTSIIDMADIDNNKKLEFVTKDTDNSLIVYKIN